MNKVLILGAGLVARPMVRYLLDRGYDVLVASRTKSRAARLIGDHPRGRAEALDVSDLATMRRLVSECDVAVSLLPATQHVPVARACVDFGKHMVTTSYVSPGMRALDEEARRKGLLLLNEIGVDPGIDHMSAMRVIHAEQAAGGTLVGFTSWCGGLPAPEANDNPFGYKFSWAPRGVLVAARNSARYLRNGVEVEIPNEQLFANPEYVDIPGAGRFEGYPNRDSIAYIGTYGFDERVKTMLRGTLRNVGHCDLYRQLIQLGLLELEHEHDFTGLTYAQLMKKLFGEPLRETIPARLGTTAAASPLEALEYIGMLAEQPIELQRGSLLDLLADRMMKTLTFKDRERDLLLMRHDIDFEYEAGQRKERVTAILVCYGIPGGDSAMARTVSLPAAIGVRMLMEGKVTQRGVCIPLDASWYEPVLSELAEVGIDFQETRTTL